MIRNIAHIGFILLFLLNITVIIQAQENVESQSAIDAMTVETEDTINGSPVEALDDLEEFMVTKELEGEIKEVGDDVIVVSVEGEKELQLAVDAETLIYVNDEKSEFKDIQTGDEIFAYYVDENGSLKCDWIEITR